MTRFFCRSIPDNLAYVRLAAATEFGIEAGTLFFDSVLAVPHFGQLVGFYMMIMKSRFLYVAHGKKDKGTALQVILYTVWLILASLPPVLGYTENYF
jgi:protoheme IX farnesyltransferase